MAEDRTIMANERTFAGWMRTGIAAMGIALGFNAVFGKVEPNWVPKLVATGFLLVAMFIFVSAYLRSAKVFERLNTHSIERVSRGSILILASVMVAGAIMLICAVWTVSWNS
ncbi:DUF202 domain-containing protein [Hellea sp.]|nr:DUF202 domain-containing protein [Hellea sp.]